MKDRTQQTGNAKAAALQKRLGEKYPPYKIEPTSATVEWAGVSGKHKVPAHILSTKAQANALAIALERVSGVQASVSADLTYSKAEWGDEKRRAWMIVGVRRFVVEVDAQINEYAGSLLLLKNASGVGAPGHWDVWADGQVKWVSDLKGED